MTIVQQAIFLPMLESIKNKMVASEVLGRFTRSRKLISYYHMLMVSIESSVGMILYWDQTDAIAEALWRLFKDELVPIYRLVEVDERPGDVPVPESLKRCLAEAREVGKYLTPP
jgi:hypothetical protein